MAGLQERVGHEFGVVCCRCSGEQEINVWGCLVTGVRWVRG